MTPTPTPNTSPPAPGDLAQRQPSFGRMFTDRVDASADQVAFRFPQNGDWASMTWGQAKVRVYAVAAGLIAIGVLPEERVSVAASTRIEWIVADLGIMCAGAATTSIYPSTTAGDFAYILADSGSRVLIAENQSQVDKALSHRAELPELMKIVVIDGQADGDLVISLADLEKLGSDLLADQPDLVDDAIAAVKPEHLATLIYTSGTTGKPKGVRLLHDSWTYEGRGVEELGILTTDDISYLWLPLSHVFGKVLIAVQLRIGFVSAVDGNLDRIVEGLGEIKPTFMAGAPRIFEKIRSRVIMTAHGEGGLKTMIFNWAIAVGHRYSKKQLAGQSVSPILAVQHTIADTLVFSKIRARVGGRIRFFVSGSAALSQPVAEWFHAVGMPLIQGYGLSETSAAAFVNPPNSIVLGTVGPPLPGTQVKIAADGEILVKGPGVMSGYHNLPEATAEVFDADGWFMTGDIGELDPNGNLRVTDRKKDLIKTSGGKYVAPQKIEILFKAVSPYASQIVVHGEGRKYCSALITLDPDAIGNWAKHRGLGDASYAALTKDPKVRELVQSEVDELNSSLEHWETIKKFEILDRDLTIEDGGLTPSMKIRRKIVETENKSLLDGMYTGD